MKAFTKDPNAVKDWTFDWTLWLTSGETISTHTVVAEAGITINSSSIVALGTKVQVWLAGGADNVNYLVTCHITTTSARQDDRTIQMEVRSL